MLSSDGRVFCRKLCACTIINIELKCLLVVNMHLIMGLILVGRSMYTVYSGMHACHLYYNYVISKAANVSDGIWRLARASDVRRNH